MAILDDNEFTEVEGRSYVNPQVALDESNTFIDNLRSTQQANNQQIQTDTYNLGTAVPSNLGGLTSPNSDTGTGLSYFTSRYQTPQTISAVANLRAAAQAVALNQALANEQEVWKKRYNDAYRAYQKSQYNKNNPDETIDGGVDYTDGDGSTGLTAEQDMNSNNVNTDVVDYTDTGFDNRSRQTKNKVEVTKDKSGNITVVTINGVPHYGREARAKYRELQRKGIVK